MFYKPFYLAFIFISALLFSSQESSGNTNLFNFNKFEHITKTPKSTSHQIINDLLVNLDDNDDEASSKTKYRLSKAITFSNNYSNYSKQFLSTVQLSFLNLSSSAGKHSKSSSQFAKTSISIAICCLRI